MSIAMIQRFKKSGLPPTARLVAYMLADHHNDASGLCNPPVHLLEFETSLSPRAISMAINFMIQEGHLTRKKTKGNRNIYILHPVEKEEYSSAGDAEQSSAGDAELTPPVPHVVLNSSAGDAEPDPQEMLNSSAGDADPLFKPEGTGKETGSKPEVGAPAAAAASPPPSKKQPSKRALSESDAKAANLEPIPLDLRCDGFPEAWSEWCEHRTELAQRDIRKMWTPRAAKNTLRQCSQHGAAVSVMAIRAALSSSHQGLYFDRLAPNGNHHNGHRPSRAGPGSVADPFRVQGREQTLEDLKRENEADDHVN